MSDEDWSWLHPERKELHDAVTDLVEEAPSSDKVGVSIDILLQDLEIYDDPRQGVGSWIFNDEASLVEALGVGLYNAIGGSVPAESGSVFLAHPDAEQVRSVGRELLSAIIRNGKGMPAA